MKICPNCQIEFDDSFMLCDQCGSNYGFCRRGGIL